MNTARVRSAGLGAAAAPVIVALVARALVGGSPADVGAAERALGEAPTRTAPALVAMTPAETAARAYARAALREPFAGSPMHRGIEAPEPSIGPAPAEPVRAEPTAPVFTVTSVLVGRRATLVTINGRLRRLGDEVEPGWRLTEIDARAGTVTLTSEDGRRERVSIAHLLK